MGSIQLACYTHFSTVAQHHLRSEAAMVAAKNLQQLVEAAHGGCYGIEWELSESGQLIHKAHYNPSWRVEAVKRMGLKGLYTTESTHYSFTPGEGVVGKVFAEQQAQFVPDLQELGREDVSAAMFSGDTSVFKRADLAKMFDIHSAMFWPMPTGVLEVGSTQMSASKPGFLPDDILKAVEEERHVPAASAAVDLSATTPKGCTSFPQLKQLVEGSKGGCYGIHWAMSDGKLKCAGYYNPDWRIEGVRKLGFKGLFTTGSSHFEFLPGEGVVGRVFQEQKKCFVSDLQELAKEDISAAMFSGDRAAFKRVDSAKEFDIRSAVFLPLDSGVLEVGSTQQIASDLEFLPVEVLKVAGLAP